MKRRLFLVGLTASAAVLATSGAVLAASYSEDVVAQLVKLGFSDITAETTLLGRVRIVARRGDGVREIVLNPRTGEVLRDTWVPSASGASTRRTVISDVSDADDDSSDDGTSGSDDNGSDDNGGDNSGGNDNSGGDNSGGDDNSGHGGGGDDRNDDRNDDREDREDDRGDREDDKRDDDKKD